MESFTPTTPARSGRTAREQVGLALLAVQRARRGALAHMRRSRLLMWRYSSPAAEELLLTPPDLRAPDPSFADEIVAGSFGLAGSAASLNGRSPFAIRPPSAAWERELNGFGWLRHLDAADSADERRIAQSLVADWIKRSRRRPVQAWSPDIVARRIISWLSHASLLLDGTEARAYAAVMRSLTDQITYLATAWRDAPDGYPRLLSLIGLVHAALCIAGHDRQLEQSQALLVSELERQVPTDGGHISRNPWTLVELLLDLLPLRRCLAARGKSADPKLLASIGRMTAMLRHLRLGDGMPARFNGMGVGERDALATVLGYDDSAPGSPAAVVRSGYARLARGATVVLMDAAPPPPMELAGAACAGCLSFELSAGTRLLLVNGGLPGESGVGTPAVARGTLNHNALCLGERSSGRLVRDARLERAIGGPPLRHPDRVTCELSEAADGGVEIEASHDGYVESAGLIHTRRLELDAIGTRLIGHDRLGPAKGILRFAWDMPYSVHFHLHPDVEARPAGAAEVVELELDNGELWRLTASGAALSIEESLYFADVAAPRPAQQVVLRAPCYGAAEVSWTLERTRTAEPGFSRRQTRAGLIDRLAGSETAFDAEEPAR